MLLLGWYVVPIHLRTDGDTCHAVLRLNLFGRVPLGQVGIHLVFSKGSINMFFAVIVELADAHFRDFVLPSISPHPFGVDFVLFRNLFSGIILGNVKFIFWSENFIKVFVQHKFDVGSSDERHS